MSTGNGKSAPTSTSLPTAKHVDLDSGFKRKVISYNKYEEMKTDLKDIADELRDASWELWFHKSQTISMQRATAYLVTNYIGFLEQELDHLSQVLNEYKLLESDRPLSRKRVFSSNRAEDRTAQEAYDSTDGSRTINI